MRRPATIPSGTPTTSARTASTEANQATLADDLARGEAERSEHADLAAAPADRTEQRVDQGDAGECADGDGDPHRLADDQAEVADLARRSGLVERQGERLLQLIEHGVAIDSRIDPDRVVLADLVGRNSLDEGVGDERHRGQVRRRGRR